MVKPYSKGFCAWRQDIFSLKCKCLEINELQRAAGRAAASA
jgi:hypothetical protein